MTVEEAIAFFKDMNECTYGNLEAVEMAIKALEQGNVLEKIRAEIVELQKDYHEYGWAYDDALEIIDKYREVSE